LLTFKKKIKKPKENKIIKKPKENKIIKKPKENYKRINREINKCHEIALKVNRLIDSDIDFTIYGWINKVSRIINISPQKTRNWIEKNYPKILGNCYKRNNYHSRLLD